jgi:hypothetical protein
MRADDPAPSLGEKVLAEAERHRHVEAVAHLLGQVEHVAFDELGG